MARSAAFTEAEESVREHFDRALRLRDANRLKEAIFLLRGVVARLDASQSPRLLPHAHLQLAHIYDKLGNAIERERHSRAAVELSPRMELASLSLFHALDGLGRRIEHLNEMLRFLRLRDSSMYREFLSGLSDADAAAEECPLFAEALRLIREYDAAKER